MTEHVRVVVVDDHSLFRTGVIQSLALDPAIEVVGDGASAADAVALVKAHRPDVALVDISMPGNGIEAVREVRGLPQAPRVIMLTVSEADDDIMRALDAGAVGYLLKGINATDLITAVKSVAAGSSFVSPTLAHRLLAGQRPSSHASALASLSDREKETLRLVARGKSNRQVARELKVQERTVKFHMSNIIRKLGVRNRVEAALIAQKELRDGVD